MSEEQKYYSLLPKDDIELLGYKDALDFAMSNEGIRNIALSGAYGSGKSSVISTYEKQNKQKKFIHISLANFKKDAGTPNAKEIVNLLEGKILNQLLHQIDPKRIKQSQFRIKADDPQNNKVRIAAFCTLFIFILLYAIRFDTWQAFVATLPPGPIDISWTASPSVRVVAILICFFMGGWSLFYLMQAHDFQKLFKKLDIKGIVGIEIFEDMDNSFFDKYLNEVLYLFEQAGADAIVFEDLDRYEVTQIFEKLKEISDLLYQRKQRDDRAETSAPKFFYLIRDDVFSTSDRSKFFDFIIPVVPVIATDNAHNLLQKRFSESGLDGTFQLRFLRAISLFLTDLRLVNNIVNEYILYQSLLGNSNLQRDPNRQLAIIIYKNLFPKDFERLQRGTGYVYHLFAERDVLLNNQRVELNNKALEIRQRLDQARQEHLHNIDELNALHFPHAGIIDTIDGKSVPRDISREELISQLLAAKKASYYTYSRNYGNYYNQSAISIDIDDLRSKMESDPDYRHRKRKIEDKDPKRRAQLEMQLYEIEQELHLLNTRKLCELVTEDDNFWLLESLPQDKRDEFEYITSSREFELLKYLMRDGYLDENYSIYISYFYPNSLTVRDKNFLLALTSHKGLDHSYPLDSPALVLDWIDESYFALEEIGNLSLFNHILEQKNCRLLKIWLDSLNGWCDTSEAAFDFPIELWRNTQHRSYLVQVINDIVPNWFERWTEIEGLLSDDEWKLYAVDTLLHSSKKTLLRMNNQEWLSAAIAQQNTFLQINDPNIDGLVNAFRILNVRFDNLIYREQDIPLLKRVYQENLYQLNVKMLELWLSIFYGAPTGESLKKSYTYLLSKPDEPLSHRVEANWEEYLGMILAQDDLSFSDTPQAVLALLNHQDTNTTYSEAYIHRLNTKLENVEEVEQKTLWPVLMDADSIVFRWENVIAYYMEYCAGEKNLDDHLISFLQRGSRDMAWTWNGLLKQIGEVERNNLYKKLIQCNELSADRYRAILKPISAYYSSFVIKDIPDAHVKILIELGIIAVTAQNVEFMRESYSNQVVDFLMFDKGNKFVTMVEASEVKLDKAELVAMLEDKRMENGIAMRLLDQYDGNLPVAGRKYSEAIQIRILESFLSTDDINWFLNNFNRLANPIRKTFLNCMQGRIGDLCTAVEEENLIPISVYAHCLQSMDATDAVKLRQYLPNKNFELVCTSNKKPRFPKSEEIRIILEYFQAHGWISSYRQLESGEYKAFSKQQKSIAV